MLDLVVSVNASGSVVAGERGRRLPRLARQGAQHGNVLTAPLTTSGFQTLRARVTVPVNVAKVQVVLRGFSPTDLARKGTVTFDDVGLFAQ